VSLGIQQDLTSVFSSRNKYYILTLQLLKLSGFGDLRSQVWFSAVEVSEESVVVNGSNGEEDLCPAKSGDGIDGSNTIGDLSAWQAWSDVPAESVHFRDDVSNDCQLSNAAVLEFSSSVLVKGSLVDVLAQTGRVPETSGLLQVQEKMNFY
jgi:hypothetical protein